MRMKLFHSMAAIGLAMVLVGCDAPQSQLKTHNDMLALDSHLDTPLVLDRAGFDISHRLSLIHI